MNARTHAMIAATLKPPEYQYLPSATLEQGSDVSSLMLNDEVVSDEDSCDRSQDSTVSVHPSEVCSAGTVDPPCLQDEERDDDRDDNALLVGDLLRSQVGESICRSYYVSATQVVTVAAVVPIAARRS